ncbi:MAG: hypothetical protein ACRD68_11275 [Pyrinomonadaceae bacterium]
MKYLLIIGLLLAAGTFLYWRLRPYIAVARRVLGVFRDARRVSASEGSFDLPRRKVNAPNEKLVRCAACGTWTPASRALALRASSEYYCSHQCLERATDSPPAARKKSVS